MDRFHYLGATKSGVSGALQYVVEDDRGEWLALLDFGYGALKNTARDNWIGWDQELKTRRLCYVITNTRFLVLPWARRIRNLASQALSLVLKRLSLDWACYHGHHVFIAETFIDPERFDGACYKASNWIYVGETRGFGRDNKHYFEHQHKKAVYVYPLHRHARKILNCREFPHPWLTTEHPREQPMVDINTLPLEGPSGLLELLKQVPDSRDPRGLRYKLSSLLALTVCALLCGCDNFLAIAEFGQHLSPEARRRLGFRIFNMPTEPVIRYTLNAIDVQLFDTLVGNWIRKHVPSLRNRAIAVDGKVMRASRTADGRSPHILTAVLHHDGIVVAQRQVPDKTNEIPEVRPMLESLPLCGATLTFDAMHTQRETAEFIVKEKHADYVMTVKDNQPELLTKLERLPDEAFSPSVHNHRQSSRPR